MVDAGNAESEQDFPESDEMVRMVMGVEDAVEVANAGLVERNDAITAGIDEEYAVSRENRRACRCPLRIGNRYASA